MQMEQAKKLKTSARPSMYRYQDSKILISVTIYDGLCECRTYTVSTQRSADEVAD